LEFPKKSKWRRYNEKYAKGAKVGHIQMNICKGQVEKKTGLLEPKHAP
jgi:hypothetical protein